jgi:hypothetical protein
MKKLVINLLLLSALLNYSCSSNDTSISNQTSEEASIELPDSELTTPENNDDSFLTDFSVFDTYQLDETETSNDFSGHFSAQFENESFSIELNQDGNRVTGSYCGYNENRSDCRNEQQGGSPCPIIGIVKEDTLFIRFKSCYMATIGEAFLTKNHINIDWHTTTFPPNEDGMMYYCAVPGKTLLVNDIQTGHLIIIGGGKSIEEAEQVKTDYLHDSTLTYLFGDRIQILLSDTIQGLNKGFYIATPGYCNYSKLANFAINLVNTTHSGIYKKEITLKENQINKLIVRDKTGALKGTKITYKDKPALIDITAHQLYLIRQGSFNVSYYLGWSSITNEILPISLLECNPILNSISTLEKTCTETSEIYTDEDQAHLYQTNTELVYKTCTYSNGIVIKSVNGRVDEEIYPTTLYSFESLILHYMKAGYFKGFLDRDYSSGEVIHGKDFDYEYTPNQNISLSEGNHYTETLYKKGDQFIFSIMNGH